MARIIVLMVLLLLTANSAAAKVLYIPLDDRPVCLEDPLTTARAAGIRIMTPPIGMLAGRGRGANPDELWKWLSAEAADADAAVISTDTLLYGGLVASRLHQLPNDVLQERLNNFRKIRSDYPALRIYAFSTVMRTPQMSAGGMDPAYFEHYGQQIFSYAGLRDKSEQQSLSPREQRDMANWFAVIPESAMLDWLTRRQKNFDVNSQLLSMTQEGLFSYFALGRDDNGRYSRTRQELRHLLQGRPSLSPAVFATFPGADQLGLVLLTRAANDLNGDRPLVAVAYAPGSGPATIPSYQGEQVSDSIFHQITAAGSYLTSSIERADLVLMVHTSANGETLEADSPRNKLTKRAETIEFAEQVAVISQSKRVAVADISFGNGADNTLLANLTRLHVPTRLAAYSGWNTASNTLGFAISQGILSSRMSDTARQGLLSVRLLDDWAYQANVRQSVKQEFIHPRGLNEVKLGASRSAVEADTTMQLKAFAAKNFGVFPVPEFRAEHPWDRMFEVHIILSGR